ncbi:hypothetical protein K439DRAFT_1382603 [Ramaria rubella]|nr:hypothetical protein K439DRAFT_1382603 [Ramaria rubella]
MGLARYWDGQTLTSCLFRLVAWLFLRVIPSPRIMPAIPALYALYIGTWLTALFNRPNSGPSTIASEKPIKNFKDELENGDSKPKVLPQKPLPHGTLSTLFLSLPTSSLILRSIVLLMNTALLLCTADFVTHPAREPATSLIFTRVGAVEPDSAKVVIRWPNPADGAIRIVWRQASTESTTLDAAWKNGPVVPLRNETDWVGVGKLSGLWPSTIYEYRLAYSNSTHLSYPDNPISFRTFPDPRLTTGNHFKFLVSSCIMPNFPYLPFKSERIRGFDLLTDYVWPMTDAHPTSSKASDGPLAPISEDLSQTPAAGEAKLEPVEGEGASKVIRELVSASETESSASVAAPSSIPHPHSPGALTEFMLLLGDFVYAEVPWYGGNDVEGYRRLYRRAYASPSFRKVYERLPIFNIYDDHEIFNNFAGQGDILTEPFPNASSAYYAYNGQANYDPIMKGGHYYEFRYGDVAYFVLDTRLYRSGQFVEEGDKKTMLGDQQLSALYEWLDRVNTTTTFKFIVSSVPFTSLWTHDAQVDSWAGYLDERDALLTALGTVPNVFVLSGDRHEFAAIEFLGGKVIEFSTSPLSAFYIPIIRTLRNHSQRLTEKLVRKLSLNETGQEVIQQELAFVPDERVLKYLPLGNYKWSAFEIDTTDRQKPTLKLEVVINGHTEWRHTIVGQPVTLKASNALGTQITRGLKGALGKIGLSPTKWF